MITAIIIMFHEGEMNTLINALVKHAEVNLIIPEDSNVTTTRCQKSKAETLARMQSKQNEGPTKCGGDCARSAENQRATANAIYRKKTRQLPSKAMSLPTKEYA